MQPSYFVKATPSGLVRQVTIRITDTSYQETYLFCPLGSRRLPGPDKVVFFPSVQLDPRITFARGSDSIVRAQRFGEAVRAKSDVRDVERYHEAFSGAENSMNLLFVLSKLSEEDFIPLCVAFETNILVNISESRDEMFCLPAELVCHILDGIGLQPSHGVFDAGTLAAAVTLVSFFFMKVVKFGAPTFPAEGSLALYLRHPLKAGGLVCAGIILESEYPGTAINSSHGLHSIMFSVNSSTGANPRRLNIAQCSRFMRARIGAPLFNSLPGKDWLPGATGLWFIFAESDMPDCSKELVFDYAVIH